MYLNSFVLFLGGIVLERCLNVKPRVAVEATHIPSVAVVHIINDRFQALNVRCFHPDGVSLTSIKSKCAGAGFLWQAFSLLLSFFFFLLRPLSSCLERFCIFRLFPTRLCDGSSVFTASGSSAVSSPLSAVGLTDAREMVWLDFDTRYRRAAVFLGSPR